MHHLLLMNYTSEKVITQENIEGFKINDKVILNELGYDKDDIVKEVNSFIFQASFKRWIFSWRSSSWEFVNLWWENMLY